jgi:imidazolonepropionase
MLLIRGAQQLVTMRGPRPRRGAEMADLGIIVDGAVLIDGDRIDEVGPTRRLENLAKARGARVIDATGKVVLPGLIDAHTRLLFQRFPTWAYAAAEDQGTFGMAEISKAQRSRSARALQVAARQWTHAMASCGTTTVEVRVGGSPDAVRRSLRAATELSGDPIQTRPVLAISAFVDQSAGTDDATEPTERILSWAANTGTAYSCELYCGEAGLNAKDVHMISELARIRGLRVKLLLGELAPDEVQELVESCSALSVGVTTALLEGSAIGALSRAESVVTLLPGIAHHARAAYPQARALIDRGAAVCLASAFGPEASPSLSMPMMMALACRRMRLTPAEAVAACTLNAAVATGLPDEIGSIEPGKIADLAVFDVTDYRQIPYYFGFNLCATTIRRGKIVYYAGSMPPLAAFRSRST